MSKALTQDEATVLASLINRTEYYGGGDLWDAHISGGIFQRTAIAIRSLLAKGLIETQSPDSYIDAGGAWLRAVGYARCPHEPDHDDDWHDRSVDELLSTHGKCRTPPITNSDAEILFLRMGIERAGAGGVRKSELYQQPFSHRLSRRKFNDILHALRSAGKIWCVGQRVGALAAEREAG